MDRRWLWTARKRELSPETRPCGNLISEFGHPELREISFCCVRHLLWGILLWRPDLTNTASLVYLFTKSEHALYLS